MPAAELPGTLARRLEEASLNAWPALQQLLYDGWLLRLAGGFTKRANSVVPLYPGSIPLARKLEFCTALYRRAGLDTVVRLATVHPLGDLDDKLAAAGCPRVDPTHVLARNLAGASTKVAPAFADLSLDAWLDVYCALSGVAPSARRLHGALLRGIALPCVFGTIEHDGRPVACGLAVIEDDLVGLFDVVTDARVRNRGFGRALVTSLLASGLANGAEFAYLQVLEANSTAIALYRTLEFVDAYRYWYRIAPTRHAKGGTRVASGTEEVEMRR